MKSDFLLAITQLSAEKNLPKDVVLTAVEAALVSAYKKDNFSPNQNIAVKINPNSGKVEVWAEKTVVEKPTDKRYEISLEEAKKLKEDAQIDDAVMVEATPANAGRIAAQTAKQVILQRLHEAEHSAIFEEYADREGEVVSGVVQRFEMGQVHIDLGRTEAILPASEQVRTERYRVGQRLKVVLLQVARTNKGPRVIVSRSHPELLRRLFELEVPEVYNGTVEIKSISREAGFRSKIAVAAKQEGIDPVGCCVGLRGIRIQNIVNELNGEKIDVIQWSPDVAAFITNALSPAQIVSVGLSEEEKIATVVVPDKVSHACQFLWRGIAGPIAHDRVADGTVADQERGVHQHAVSVQGIQILRYRAPPKERERFSTCTFSGHSIETQPALQDRKGSVGDRSGG